MMMLRALIMILAAGALYAQPRELPVESDHAPPVLERLNQAPLPADQKEHIRRSLQSQDYKTAETALVKAIDANPKSTALLTLAAGVFFLDKSPLNAAIALKKAEAIQPLSERDRFTLALAYIGMGREKWARPELDKLAAADPANPLFPYWLSRIDYDERNYKVAAERLRTITRNHPDFMRAWDNLGLCLEGAGQLDEAAASYQEAVRLNRDKKLASPWPPLNLGTLLTRMGRLKEGEQLLRESLMYQENLAETHSRLGVNLRKQGRPADAIAQLRRAVELDPDSSEPLYALGQLYRDQGNAAAASEAFARLRELKKQQRQ